jgi:hypothetical protein
MQDLSHLAANGPWVSSQAGGNMISGNDQAQTGPGSPPADPLPDRDHQGDPSVTASDTRPVGTPGPRRPVAYTPVPVIWKDI